MPLSHEEFVRRLVAAQGPLRGYLLTHLRDQDRVEDVLQEVSVVLWRKLDSYRAELPFLPWALGIARHEVLHARRESARSRIVFDQELSDRAAHRLEALEPELSGRRAALRHCLEKLPPRHRDVVQHRYLDALPVGEVARRTGRSEGAVHMLLSRIRSALGACAERVLKGSSPEIPGDPGA